MKDDLCPACRTSVDAVQWMTGLDEHGFAEYINRQESKIVVHRIESSEKWISVTDRLPDIYQYVIVLEETSGTSEPKPISIARRINENHLGYIWDFLAMNDDGDTVGAYMDISYPIDSGNITHWMPMPKPPTN